MWFKYKGRIEIKNSKNNQGRHFVYPFCYIVIPNLFRNLATGEISPWSACDLGIITV